MEDEVSNFGDILRDLKDINDKFDGKQSASAVDSKVGMIQQPELILTF
jgi:hypothetical protein